MNWFIIIDLFFILNFVWDIVKLLYNYFYINYFVIFQQYTVFKLPYPSEKKIEDEFELMIILWTGMKQK